MRRILARKAVDASHRNRYSTAMKHNPAAVALGRLAKGKPKRLSAEQRIAQRDRMAVVNERRSQRIALAKAAALSRGSASHE